MLSKHIDHELYWGVGDGTQLSSPVKPVNQTVDRMQSHPHIPAYSVLRPLHATTEKTICRVGPQKLKV